MTAVTGATGQVGSEVVRRIGPCRILSRCEGFDFSKPETYLAALEGITQLFLVCPTDTEVEQIVGLLDAGKELEYVVFISGMGAQQNPRHFLAQIEKVISVPFAALRANWFYQNFSSIFHEMVINRVLTFPDGRAALSFVDARDVAELACICFEQRLEGTFEVTGPQSLTHAKVAQLFTKHLFYEVSYCELTDEIAREVLGWDDQMLELFKDIRKGYCSPISPTMPYLLQKPARSFEEYIIEFCDNWKQ